MLIQKKLLLIAGVFLFLYISTKQGIALGWPRASCGILHQTRLQQMVY
jgi:hypothetical protein